MNGKEQHKYHNTLGPDEAIIYAMSVRWPGEWCSLNRLASVSHQNKQAAYDCAQRLFESISEVEREYSETGMPLYRWVPTK